MRIASHLLCAMLLFPVISTAFEYERYKSGMSRSEVEKIASETAKLSKSRDDLIARFHDGSYMTFNFCNDSLVSMQQGQPPNLRQFSMIVEEFNRAHGAPVSVVSTSRVSPKGQIQELGLWWGKDGEYVSVYYIDIGEEGEALSTSRQVRNSCFKVPR